MSNDDTLVVGFEKQDDWGDFYSLADRRFYLRRQVIVDSDHQIKPANFHPGGFNHDTSNLFVVNQNALNKAIRHQSEILEKIWDMPSKIGFHSEYWNWLQSKMVPLALEYKIHLQPREKYIPVILSRLVWLILEEPYLRKNIAAFKTRCFGNIDFETQTRATTVIYLNFLDNRREARQMCRQVIAILKDCFADYEALAENRLPIYTYPVTNLLSFIQVGTDTKFCLDNILGRNRFQKLFPLEYNRALLLDERIEYYL